MTLIQPAETAAARVWAARRGCHGSLEVMAGAHCRERSSIQSKGLGVL